MKPDDIVRQQLLSLLKGGNAHASIEQAVASFPLEQINSTTPGITYTPWQLLEHMRIAQRDILEFIRDSKHVSPKWPEGYWPPEGEPGDVDSWEKTLRGLRVDLETITEMTKDPATDLYAPIPHAPNYTILREVLLVADHNAYHIGQLVALRKALGIWPAK